MSLSRLLLVLLPLLCAAGLAPVLVGGAQTSDADIAEKALAAAAANGGPLYERFVEMYGLPRHYMVS